MEDFQFAECGMYLADLVRQTVEGTVPEDVLEEHGSSLFFICMGSRDGIRLTRHVQENFEVIVLSGHVAPSRHHINETDPVFRYFMYVILHEVAHAIRKHRSQYFDGITPEENAAQEEEADVLAMQWFNERAQDLGNPEMTEAELTAQQARTAALMHGAWWQ